MALTTAQRAEINRQNAQKSTGPKSDEGKAASRRNATKHGLRAEVLALPDEDPAIAAARSDAWNDYYQPKSPGAQHLVNDCVAATLLSDRCHKYHAAALSKQIRNAELQWETDRENSVESLALLIKTDPGLAVHRLKQSAHGLRWMIGAWEELQTAFEEFGCWTNPELDLAIRLMGLRPEPAHLRESPPAWLTRLLAVLSHERPAAQAIQFLFDPKHLPDKHRREYRADFYPDRENCQSSLRALMVEELEQLRQNETILNAFDAPDRAEAGDRALILHDPASARLFLRYHSEARNSFHRSFSALLRTLERDAASDDTDSHAVAAPPNVACAPESPPPPPPVPNSPNEANSDASSRRMPTSAWTSERSWAPQLMVMPACVVPETRTEEEGPDSVPRLA